MCIIFYTIQYAVIKPVTLGIRINKNIYIKYGIFKQILNIITDNLHWQQVITCKTDFLNILYRYSQL